MTPTLALAAVELIAALIERVRGAHAGHVDPIKVLAEIDAFKARLAAIDAAADAAVDAKFHHHDPPPGAGG